MKKITCYFILISIFISVQFQAKQLSADTREGYSRALKAYTMGKNGQALSILENLLKDNWNNYDVVLLAAFVCWRAKKYSWAMADFERAIQLSPAKITPYLSKVEMLVDMEKWHESEKYAEKTSDIFSEKWQIWNLLARIYLKNKKLDQAIKASERSITLKSDNFESYNILGLVYLRLSKLSHAHIAFKTALSLSPNNPFILNNLGVVNEKQKKFDKAKEYFQKALEIEPNHPTARENLERMS